MGRWGQSIQDKYNIFMSVKEEDLPQAQPRVADHVQA